jgi:PAS domain S-box-containing protein
MWIATRHSLYRWQDRKLEEFPRMKSVRAIFRDRNGTMWFGTQTAGITSLKDGVFTGYTMPGGNNTGLFFAENPAGEVFTGNRSALYKVVGHQLVEITGLPDKRVRAIHFDPDGNMWISTRDLGLAVFSGGRWFIPAAANEALLKLVTSINEDAQGNLWVGSGRGICRVSRTNLLAEARGETSAATLHFATQEDGVRPGYSAYGNYPFGAFGNYPITAVGPDGRIWFAQRTSVVAVNPPALRLNPSPPPVKIERVLADEQPVDASAGQITLPAGTRRLTIQYAALSFVQPARVLSSYRLVGADASWTPPSPGRSADYTGLPPGSYQFQVKACNSDGVWNETGDSLAFTVQPFYWQTLWFRLLVLASLAASGGFTVWRVVRTKLRRRERTISFQNTLLSLRDHAGDDLAAYFGMTTAGIATTLRVERASIWLFDAAHAAIVCQDLFCLSTRKHDRGLRLGAADYPAYFKTISSQGWVVADDARTNPATREFTESYLTPLDITSLLDAPLFVHGTLSGTLCCEHTGAARVWTTEEIEFVVSASSYVMLAMEQAERGKAEALKGAILESALDCIITINHEGKIIEFNPAAERTFGYSRGEALGRDMAELIVPPQFRERHHEGMAHFLTTGASPVVNQRLEMPAQRADGTEFPIELSIVRVGRTEPPQFTGFVRDITERKRAERDLMMSLSLLQATLESTTDGIQVVNHERRIVSFNRKFIQMWSIPEAIIASRNDQQAIDFVLDQLKDPDGFLAKVKELYSHAEAESFDILELKSGRAFERYSQPQRVAGRSVGRVWSFRDVTERKQAEERLQQSHEQLRALSSRLESLREEERSRIAREIHDHLGQLLTALKLDMRSLERKIAGVAETELRVALAGKINSALMVADETIASVQKIASELRPGVLDRLGLPAAIEMETQAFQSRTGIPCKWNIPKDSVPLPQEHATAMFRIFQELLTNIARHAQATQVAVRLSCDEGELELHVKDDGVGIQPGDIENPKSLGLLGMRERVMILGGTIKFAGKSGKGTTVTVQLPFGKNTGQSV